MSLARVACGALALIALTAFPSSLPASAATPPSPEAQQAAKFLTPQEVVQRMKRGDKLVIGDVRKEDSFKVRRIQGAKSLPSKQIAQWGPKLSANDVLVLYCACPHDEASIIAAYQLTSTYKRKNVYVLKGGINEWIAKGYPFDLQDF